MAKNGNGFEHVPPPLPEWKELLLNNNRRRKEEKRKKITQHREEVAARNGRQPVQIEA